MINDNSESPGLDSTGAGLNTERSSNEVSGYAYERAQAVARDPEPGYRYKRVGDLIMECYRIAKEKGFWDCRRCEGKGKYPLMVVGGLHAGGDIQCETCSGTGKLDRNTGELLMLITSELGEALEAHRKGRFASIGNFNALMDNKYGADEDHDEAFKLAFEQTIKGSYEEEIADVFIRIMDLCGGQEIDLEFFVFQKMKYNATRDRLHGKAY